MVLASGSRLGPHEILSPLGAGGMSACGYAALAAKRLRPARGERVFERRSAGERAWGAASIER